MKNERSLRVFIGLGIMAGTVGAVGSIGGWSRPEPPSDHASPAKSAAPKPAAKPEIAPPESTKIEPLWSDPARPAGAAKAATPKPEPMRAEQAARPAPAGKPAAQSAAPSHESSKPESKTPADPSQAETAPTPDEALKLLQDGNARWTAGSVQSPNVSESRRRTLADSGQTPFATVLTCADSRVPVERVFDRGVGDLFVIRVAGNVTGPHEAGTIEYGAEHLHVPLLVVMGHTKCGAVSAAASHAKIEGNVSSLVSAIAPAVERAESLNPGLKDAQLVGAAVRENVWQSVFDLIKTSPVCRERIRAGELRIVGAVYDISTGEVEWLGEHPWEKEFIAAMDARDAARRADAPSEESH